MLINTDLLAQAWQQAKAYPGQYDQSVWAVKTPDREAFDIAGLALKLIGAAFCWTPVAIYPPALGQAAVWGASEIRFSSLPPVYRTEIIEYCTHFTKDFQTPEFWQLVTADKCPISLAARMVLGIDTADGLVLFEEDATAGEVQRKVDELLERGAWQRRPDASKVGAHRP